MGLALRELCPERNEWEPAAVTPPAGSAWFAVVSKPQHERAVLEGLTCKGLESFLPVYACARQWSDRTKKLELPLFPGYVFCRFARNSRLPVLQTPGVRSVVAFAGEMAAISGAEIEQIRRMAASGHEIQPWPFLKVGQRVRVCEGALAGLDGILTEERNGCRLVVGLELLQRSVAVQLERNQVTPL